LAVSLFYYYWYVFKLFMRWKKWFLKKLVFWLSLKIAKMYIIHYYNQAAKCSFNKFIKFIKNNSCGQSLNKRTVKANIFSWTELQSMIIIDQRCMIYIKYCFLWCTILDFILVNWVITWWSKYKRHTGSC
jgi:hypothetical protein